MMVKEKILIKQRKQELMSEGQRVGFCIFKIGKLFCDDHTDSLQSLAKSLGSITNKIHKAKGLSSLAHLQEQLTQLNKKIHVKLKESFAKSHKAHPLVDKIRQAIEQKKKDSADLTAFEDSIYSPLR